MLKYSELLGNTFCCTDNAYWTELCHDLTTCHKKVKQALEPVGEKWEWMAWEVAPRVDTAFDLNKADWKDLNCAGKRKSIHQVCNVESSLR